jgi:predicted secreted protein
MAAAAGRNAAIYIDDTSAGNGSAHSVSGKNSWAVNQPADRIDVTPFRALNKETVAGMPDASGDISGFWDPTDTLQYNLVGSSVARKLYIYPDQVNSVTTYFFTTAFFDLSFTGSTTGAVEFSGSWSAASVGDWVTP